MQDQTGGIAVYDADYTTLNRGDSIRVTGNLTSYNNLLEISDVSLLTVISSGNALPQAKVVTIGEIGEEYEGQLIRINNIQMLNPGGTFSGGTNYDFSDGTNQGELRINADSPVVGQPIPSGSFDLIAICSQFSYTTNNTDNGYQLLPRDMNDFISGSSVNFSSVVSVIDITKNSLVLTWITDNAATPFVRYGSSVDNLNNIKEGDSNASDEQNLHQVELLNLDPAEVVYAQAFMVLGDDTVYSSVRAYATQSNSTGAVKIYFNSGVDQSLANGVVAMDISDNMEDTLAAYINRAQQTIDLSVYNFDNTTISNALNTAYDRGVKIRFITCGSTSHLGINDLEAGIPFLERPELQEGGIMHNKFAIFDVDATDPDKVWVWSGSTNLTPSQLYSDANNMIFIQDQSLAKAYKIEFEEMWGSNGDTPDATNAKFGEDKSDNTPHNFIIGGKNMESYFSPSDDTNHQLIDAIASADYNLYVETMVITRSDLSAAIVDAFDRGVEVRVMTNAEGDNTTYVNDALQNTLDQESFVYDGDVAGTLHHKVAIIDADNDDSDPILITGSHNWSSSANERNDENTLVIHDEVVANQYLQQFAYRFKQNDGILYVGAELVEIPEIKVYPNPTTGSIRVSSDKTMKSIQLYGLRGGLLKEWSLSAENAININIPQNLKGGIYLLKVQGVNGGTNVYKLVKQ